MIALSGNAGGLEVQLNETPSLSPIRKALRTMRLDTPRGDRRAVAEPGPGRQPSKATTPNSARPTTHKREMGQHAISSMKCEELLPHSFSEGRHVRVKGAHSFSPGSARFRNTAGGINCCQAGYVASTNVRDLAVAKLDRHVFLLVESLFA